MRLTLVLTAVLALGAAAPAAAAPPPATPPAASARQSTVDDARLVAEAQAWLTELGKWAQAMQLRVHENAEVMGEMATGFEKAVELFDDKDRKAAKAWAADWSRAQKERIARLRALAADTPAPPEPPAALLAVPRFAVRMQGIRDSATGISTNLNNTAATGDRYVELISAAAGGSVEALQAAIPVTIDTFVITLRGEAAVADIMAEASEPGHPQRDLMNSSASLNRAMIEMFQHQRASLVEGEAGAGPAYADRMDRHIADARKAARSIEPHTTELRARLAAMPSHVEGLAARVAPLLDGMTESAAVELEIAAEMEKIAVAVRQDESLDSPAVVAALTRVEALTTKRANLINARRDAFVANQ